MASRKPWWSSHRKPKQTPKQTPPSQPYTQHYIRLYSVDAPDNALIEIKDYDEPFDYKYFVNPLDGFKTIRRSIELANSIPANTTTKENTEMHWRQLAYYAERNETPPKITLLSPEISEKCYDWDENLLCHGWYNAPNDGEKHPYRHLRCKVLIPFVDWDGVYPKNLNANFFPNDELELHEKFATYIFTDFLKISNFTSDDDDESIGKLAYEICNVLMQLKQDDAIPRDFKLIVLNRDNSYEMIGNWVRNWMSKRI